MTIDDIILFAEFYGPIGSKAIDMFLEETIAEKWLYFLVRAENRIILIRLKFAIISTMLLCEPKRNQATFHNRMRNFLLVALPLDLFFFIS